MKHRLDSLDLGRFIAAMVVMMDHFLLFPDTRMAKPGASLFWGLSSPGAVAVEYFFTLSGFVMLTAHWADFGKWRAPLKFWWRRACRILPVFWIALLFPVFYYRHVLAMPVLLQQFLLLPWQGLDMIYPAWSMHFEIAFYVIFGLCLLPRIGLWILGGWISVVLFLLWPAACLFALKTQIKNFAHIDAQNCFASGFELYFFCGLAAAAFYVKGKVPGRWGFAPVLAGVSLVSLSQYGSDYGQRYPVHGLALCCAAGFALVIYGLGCLEAAGKLRLGAWAAKLGSTSYPLYMINAPVLMAFWVGLGGRQLDDAGLYEVLAAGLVTVGVCTCILTFWIDLPLQRFLRGLFAGKR
jgi:peptidoglycan/LPS O-acetylase OafA/YrhL